MLDITNQILDRIKDGKRLSASEVVLLVNDYNHDNSIEPAISPNKVMDELFELIKEKQICLTSDKTRLGFVFTNEINF